MAVLTILPLHSPRLTIDTPLSPAAKLDSDPLWRMYEVLFSERICHKFRHHIRQRIIVDQSRGVRMRPGVNLRNASLKNLMI